MAKKTSVSRPSWDGVEISEHDQKYTGDEWVQPASDNRGHSERIGFRIPPQVVSELELVLEHFRRISGYRAVNDIVRHALMRHLAFLHAIEPTMKPTYLGALQAMQLVLAEDRQRSETEAIFRELERRIDDHMQRGDRGETVRLIYETKRRLDNTPNTPWKRRWLDRYKVRYAHYLTAGDVPPGDAVDSTRDAALDAPVEDEDTIN